MDISAAQKCSRGYESYDRKQALGFVASLINDARMFLEGCKEDLEVLAFLRRYEARRGECRGAMWEGLTHTIARAWRSSLKNGIDRILGCVATIFFLPVMAVLAVAIKSTSPGPAIYRQERVGKNGVVFTMYKFRTMRNDAETGTGPQWAKQQDPRVTPLGNFLRKAHLDELPQLFNVIKGEMSIVGPRPERPFFVEKLKREIPHYEHRLMVKPGITGLAQVRHKYDETIADVRKKVRYDLMYIKKMCLALDAKVMFWTVGVALTGKGAH